MLGRVLTPRAWLSIAALVICVLGAVACAKSERPLENGQAHWLRSCHGRTECGELSCICGVCSAECGSHGTCGAHPDTVCRGAEEVNVADACEQPVADVSLCVPSCDSDRDCTAMARSARCRAHACVLTAVADSDASVRDAGESPVLDAAPSGDAPQPDSGDAKPDAGLDMQNGGLIAGSDAGTAWAQVTCDGLVNGDLPAGIESIADFPDGLQALVADDAAVYGSRGLIPTELWRVGTESTKLESLRQQSGMANAGALAIDGDELFFGATDADARAGLVAKLLLSQPSPADLSQRTEVDLAQEPAVNILGLLLEGNLVYWLSDDGKGSAATASIWRSDREPGSSVMFASIGGQPVNHSLQLLGDWLYFLTYAGEKQTQLVRVRKDGTAPAEALGPSEQGENALLSDGTSLFMMIARPAAAPGVARVDVGSGSHELIFPAEDVQVGVLAADATYLYWSAGAGDASAAQALWRGRRDGSGKAVKLAEGWEQPTRMLSVSASEIYWTVGCDPTNSNPVRVLRLSKSALGS